MKLKQHTNYQNVACLKKKDLNNIHSLRQLFKHNIIQYQSFCGFIYSSSSVIKMPVS